MSYQEKKIVTTTVTSIFILASYCIYAVRKYAELGSVLQNDMAFWSGTMLLFIGISVIASIVIMILMHILLSVTLEIKKEVNKEIGRAAPDVEIEDIEDEMDKLIDLKATKISYITVGIGFVAALLTSFRGMPPAIMINVIFISFFAGSIIGGVSQLYYYKKGVPNG